MTYDVHSKLETLSSAQQDVVQHADDIHDVSDDIILRSIMSAIADVRAMLSDYIVEGSQVADNVLISETKKVKSVEISWGGKEGNDDRDNTQTIILRVPLNYAESQTNTLSTSAHDYIVCKSISDALTATANVQLAQSYQQAALEHLQQLTSAIYARRRVQRTHRALHNDNLDMRYE